MTPEERLERYARLAVEVGANVGEGQVLWVIALPEHAPLARAIAAARTRKAPATSTWTTPTSTCAARGSSTPTEDTLDWTPPWMLEKIDYLAEEHGALIQIVGDPEPELLADLDGARVGKTRMRRSSQSAT